MKKLLLGLLLTVSITGVTACAGNIPSPGMRNNDSFGLLNSENNQAKHFDKMHNQFKGFLKELNLTEAQKAQFNELKQSMKGQFNNNKGTREEFTKILK